jgi:hypothetical protein
MQLDPTTAQPILEGYRHILLMVYSLYGMKGHRTPVERMIAARMPLYQETELLDEAVAALAGRRGVVVDKEVVAAIRTLEVGKWVYLRDLSHHSILLHPDGYVAYGVVGLTQSLRELTGGPGLLFEAGIMAVPGQFICDGLLSEVVALGPGFLADYNKVFQEVKATGAFHKVPKPGFFLPPRELAPGEYQAILAARAASKAEEKKPSRSAPGPKNTTPAVLSSRALPESGPGEVSPPSTGARAKDAYREVIQLKVTLAEIEPPVWRRLRIPMDYTLARLHKVIQAAFGWEDSHLHRFRIHGEDYMPLDDENEPETRDEEVALKRVGLRLKTKFRYEYDFGDSWEHLILVEGLLLLEEPAKVPDCIGGQRACPPEDCGGAGGYQEMLDALRNSRDSRGEELRLWLGTRTWNAEAFDLERVNASIAKATGPRGGIPRLPGDLETPPPVDPDNLTLGGFTDGGGHLSSRTGRVPVTERQAAMVTPIPASRPNYLNRVQGLHRQQPMAAAVDVTLGRPLDLVVLATKSTGANCRLLGRDGVLSFRTSRRLDVVPGHILTVKPDRVWARNGHTYLSGELIAVRFEFAALGLVPLALDDWGPWDPKAEYWGEEGGPRATWAKAVRALGPRPSFELEACVPGCDPEDWDSDPIHDAIHLWNSGQPAQALRLLEAACQADLRCLDGYGLCLWRLGRFHEAKGVFERMLWMNPSDNQGVRFVLPAVRAKRVWEDFAAEEEGGY